MLSQLEFQTNSTRGSEFGLASRNQRRGFDPVPEVIAVFEVSQRVSRRIGSLSPSPSLPLPPPTLSPSPSLPRLHDPRSKLCAVPGSSIH
eukprot:1346350-Rhodomonas_salina.1